MEKFKEVPKVYSSKRQGKPDVLESGNMLWSKADGNKRKQIIEQVGLEYKQINYLAEILLEVIKVIPELQTNTIVISALDKFNTINEIRKS